jgi:hypothetical protein
MTKHTKYKDNAVLSTAHCGCGWVANVSCVRLSKKLLNFHVKKCKNEAVINDFEDTTDRTLLYPSLPNYLVKLKNI